MSDKHTYETVSFDTIDNVGCLTLMRPERLNALTPKLFVEAEAAIRDGIHAGIRALVIVGEGRAFCSGADLQGLPEDLGLVLEQSYNPFMTFLAGLDLPIITAINGLAAGAGASLGLAGDISVMGRNAYLLLSFVNIGLVPDAGASWFVANAAGRVRALEMALLGERMLASEAHAIGLVTRVVDDEQVLDEARAIARKLANGPTLAIALIRKQIANALTSSLTETLSLERDNQRIAGRTKDFADAVAAFAAKRPPAFSGR